MKRRSIIWYWTLLLVPTLLIAAAVSQLLWHEQERIDQLARASAMDRVRAIADTVQVTIEAVENDLAHALRRIPGNRLAKTLVEWEETNPLIRNVFVWQPGIGLVYPLPGRSATREERRFVERYIALFSGRTPWHAAQSEIVAPGTAQVPAQSQGVMSQQSQAQHKQERLVQGIRKLLNGRDRLQELAKGQGRGYSGKGRMVDAASRERGGWIPWFSENRLHILGWVQQRGAGPIYGIELELVTLLSRLVADFPSSVPEGTVYALIDGEGRILHQAGDMAVETGAKPDLSISLSPHLPHWQVAAYFGGGHPVGGSNSAFFILSTLLLAIFVAAILIGGGLLTWQAHRNMVDARQKTSFVSSVSHELKTPLTSIRMYAELLREGRVREPEKRERYLQVIVDESRRLTRLVNNVLDFSRLEQGRKHYHIEAVELVAFLRGILEAQRPRLHEAGLAMTDQIPSESICVRTDRDSLEQVVLNIVDNAIKYAAQGGELLVTLEFRADWCQLKFLDRGPGVPPAHRESIFEKFHRVDDSLTARQPGSGLGLTIALRILRDLGGGLRYEPREGGGSCFTVFIPAQCNGGRSGKEPKGHPS